MTCSEILKKGASTLRSWSNNFKLQEDSRLDRGFLFTIIGLVIFGLIMVYSASFIFAHERTGDGFSFIKKQLFHAALGFGFLYLGSRIDYRKWESWTLPLVGLIIGLLILVLIPQIGITAGGARRWLGLGFVNFQPAELAKFIVVLVVARQLTVKRDRINRFTAGVLGNFLIPLPILFLLLLQPDFGSFAMICIVTLLLMFLGGVPKRFLAVSIGSALFVMMILIWTSPYRVARFFSFLDPWKDPSGKGFQIIQSLIGFFNGHILGSGLGNGKEKLFFLPEAHNDFIFAVIGEELGFLGVALVVAAFLYLVYRGLRIGWQVYERRNDRFALLLASGLTLSLGVQAFINMAVVLGLLPTKGLTLPFVSYGGSALLFNLFMAGVILSISRHARA